MSKISLQEFINKTKGTRVPVPWNAPGLTGQCVSLIQQYISQCLGQPARARGHANAWDETYVREGLGTITKNPRYGDLVVYNYEPYGHIAIYIDSNTVYEQNVRSHDNRCAGYGPIWKNYAKAYIRPNAELIPDGETAGSTYSGSFPTLPLRGYFRNKDTGSNVKLLQKFLNWANDDALVVDGIIGPKTIASVKKFQRAAGRLSVDGLFGKNTLAAAKSYRK